MVAVPEPRISEPTLKSEPAKTEPPRVVTRRRWLIWAAVAVALALVYPVGRMFVSRGEPASVAVAESKPADKPAPLPASISTASGEMVLIPGGSFMSGEASTPMDLAPFYIDKTEVTNAAFAQFCMQTQRQCASEV